jgi:hypothetical protein
VAFDEELARRVRLALSGQDGIVGKRMFGGLAFMLHGNMSVGVDKDRLMVRVGPDRYEEALTRPHARPMKRFVYVPPEGLQTDTALQEWVQMGVDFALTLPRK